MNFALKILITFSLCCSGFCSYAQQIVNPPALEKLLAGKTNFIDIKNTVKKYYEGAIQLLSANDTNALKVIKRQLKMWQRWSLHYNARLNADGTLGNKVKYTQMAFEKLMRNPVSELHSASGSWQPLGPTNYNITGGHNGGLGRVNCIAFHPQNANIIYAGTANGGLWRREPNGNWTALTDHIPSVSVSGVVVNYNNANDIYILTGDGDSGGNQGMFSAGVFESHDGGNSWAASGQFPGLADTLYNGYKLVQHPTNPAIFFACTSKGLYRSADYCGTWTRVNPNGWNWAGTEVNFLPSYTDLEFKPGDPNTIYTCSNNVNPKFQISNNGGLSFTTINNASMNAAQRLAIGVSANQPNWVYVLSGPSVRAGSFNGIFGSVNSGINWNLNTTIPNILGYDVAGQDSLHQTNYDLAIAVNPANALQIITGGIDCYSSANGGTTMTKRTHWNTKTKPANMSYIHADIHNLTYNGSRLYACTDGGVSYSDDHGTTWVNIWHGLNILQPYKIAGIETDVNHWISGTQDNGTMYRNNSGFVVQHIGGGDGRSALIDPSNVSNVFFTANETVNFSTNAGQTAGIFTPPGSDETWPTLTHNINNFAEILAGYGNGIFKFNPTTLTWSNRGAAGGTALINCPSSSNRFYAAQGNIIYRSDDGGDTWINLSNKPGLVLLQNGYNITDLSVSPSNSGQVYATIGGFTEGQKIYMSNNGGETWTNISGELPNVATLSVAAGTSGSIYVGNELGVFYKKGNGNVWQPFYNGLPKCPVNDLLINFSQGKIRAATFGRGIWESDLYSTCAASQQVSGEVRGSRYYEAGSSLMATQQAAGGIGTQLVYKSGHNITLTTGMEVKDAATGTRFRAYLGPCGEGLQQLAVTGDSALNAYTIEELDTYKCRPHSLEAYYALKDDVLEFYVPDYAVISITQTTSVGKVNILVEQGLFAKGLYRIPDAGKEQGTFYYSYNGKWVELLQLKPSEQ